MLKTTSKKAFFVLGLLMVCQFAYSQVSRLESDTIISGRLTTEHSISYYNAQNQLINDISKLLNEMYIVQLSKNDTYIESRKIVIQH